MTESIGPVYEKVVVVVATVWKAKWRLLTHPRRDPRQRGVLATSSRSSWPCIRSDATSIQVPASGGAGTIGTKRVDELGRGDNASADHLARLNHVQGRGASRRCEALVVDDHPFEVVPDLQRGGEMKGIQ